MCTAVLSIEPGLPVLLAGIRDEFTDRAWEPPARHWPRYPGLIGGLDLLASGTWLAVAPGEFRAACVLNGRGKLAPARSRRSRGVLPLQAAAGEKLDRDTLEDTDPFHLLTAEPGKATMASWDGTELVERELAPGLHFVVNSGLASDLLAAKNTADRPTAQPGPSVGYEAEGRQIELARIERFVPKFQAARRPWPRPGESMTKAWGDWLPLVVGDGIATDDPHALIVRRDLGDGRAWGTTSISLVALAPGATRYDFTGSPGDTSSWRPVENERRSAF